jgi:hypothetical protein
MSRVHNKEMKVNLSLLPSAFQERYELRVLISANDYYYLIKSNSNLLLFNILFKIFLILMVK